LNDERWYAVCLPVSATFQKARDIPALSWTLPFVLHNG
jgi:hypothetical protein